MACSLQRCFAVRAGPQVGVSILTILATIAALAADGWPRPAQRRDRASRSIDRIDTWVRRRAAATSTPGEPVDGRPNLRRISSPPGDLLHIDALSPEDHPRGKHERSVHLTAQHLRMPIRAVPPVVPFPQERHASAFLAPWLRRLRSLLESSKAAHAKGFVAPWLEGLRSPFMDSQLLDELRVALHQAPQRIDWESVHAVLLLDYITAQDDRRMYNVFFRQLRGKLTAVAIDNEATFGRRLTFFPVQNSLLAELVRIGRGTFEPAGRLSPRLVRGLRGIDVEAWKADLLHAGIPPDQVELAAGRLARVQADGLAAIL